MNTQPRITKSVLAFSSRTRTLTSLLKPAASSPEWAAAQPQETVSNFFFVHRDAQRLPKSHHPKDTERLLMGTGEMSTKYLFVLLSDFQSQTTFISRLLCLKWTDQCDGFNDRGFNGCLMKMQTPLSGVFTSEFWGPFGRSLRRAEKSRGPFNLV